MTASRPSSRAQTPTAADYENLLEFRTRLRRFLRWSEEQARSQGLTAAQHQLLLAIKGHPDQTVGPSIRDVAGYLLLQHHSAVGLIDRAEAAGLVTRNPDQNHRSTVRLRLTDDGARRLEALSELVLQEVPRLASAMRSLFADVDASSKPAGEIDG
jgi:DNA-binding MarR family transcriptional regulator